MKSGLLYNLVILLTGILTLVLPAIAATVLFAPDSGLTRLDSNSEDDSIETLKRRYATGELDHEEFDQRLETLIGVSGDTLDWQEGDHSSERATREKDSEPVSE